MTINYAIIGRRIKELRVQNNISQAKLAELVEMSVAYISIIETGKKQASLKSLVLIADTLGVTVDNLLNGNQKNDINQYQTEFAPIMDGCSCYEKRIIYEVALAAKRSLVENRRLCNDDKSIYYHRP